MSEHAPAGDAAERQDDQGLDDALVHPAPEDRARHRADDEREARQWAVAAHLSALVGLLGIPAILGPLVVWLLKREDHGLVDREGKEALNFQLSLLIYAALGLVAFVILVITIIGILLVPFLLLAALVFWILSIVLPIVAAVKTSNSETYRYPLTLRLIT